MDGEGDVVGPVVLSQQGQGRQEVEVEVGVAGKVLADAGDEERPLGRRELAAHRVFRAEISARRVPGQDQGVRRGENRVRASLDDRNREHPEELGLDENDPAFLERFVPELEDHVAPDLEDPGHRLDLGDVRGDGGPDRGRDDGVKDPVFGIDPLERDPVEAVAVLFELVIGELVRDVDHDQEEADDARREADDVDQGEEPGLPHVPESHLEKVSDHGQRSPVPSLLYTIGAGRCCTGQLR